MDRPGARQAPEGEGDQRKMEKTGCGVICGAPTSPRLRKGEGVKVKLPPSPILHGLHKYRCVYKVYICSLKSVFAVANVHTLLRQNCTAAAFELWQQPPCTYYKHRLAATPPSFQRGGGEKQRAVSRAMHMHAGKHLEQVVTLITRWAVRWWSDTDLSVSTPPTPHPNPHSEH